MTFVQATIDGRNLFDPAPPFGVLQAHHRFQLPVKVISDEGYLLVERFEGIA
jgi:hypothetical protein